jgi:hypothetical protein
VGRGQVPLVGRARDALEREETENLPVLADRLAVDAERLAAVPLDLLGERLDGTGRLLRGTAQRAAQFS